MSEFISRTKDYQEAIREILLREWDPIGVADTPEAHDEYDSYIHQIHLMLISRETRQNIIDHLWWIETEHMGLYGTMSRTEAIADRLISLRDSRP